MENATKALMIAAAVLVAILIISLGIGIFTSASEQMGDMDLSEYQVQEFNNKFKNYEGTNVSGSEVNALLDTAFNHNNAQDDKATCITVKLDGTTVVKKSNSIKTSPAKVPTVNKYSVVATYDTTTNLIKQLTITKN